MTQPDLRTSVAGQYLLSRRPPLEAVDFDLGGLGPGTLTAPPNASGDVLGLPISLAEHQFYVNLPRLSALGVAISNPWTYGASENAILVARGQGGGGPAVVGLGWSAINIWAAFVVGLGGQIMASSSGLSLGGAVSATGQLVELAREAQWDPLGTLDMDFAVGGFSGPTAMAVFGLAAPWTIGIATDTQSGRPQLAATARPALPHAAGGRGRSGELPIPTAFRDSTRCCRWSWASWRPFGYTLYGAFADPHFSIPASALGPQDRPGRPCPRTASLLTPQVVESLPAVATAGGQPTPYSEDAILALARATKASLVPGINRTHVTAPIGCS